MFGSAAQTVTEVSTTALGGVICAHHSMCRCQCLKVSIANCLAPRISDNDERGYTSVQTSDRNMLSARAICVQERGCTADGAGYHSPLAKLFRGPGARVLAEQTVATVNRGTSGIVYTV